MVQRLAEVQPVGCTQRHQMHISQTRQAPEYLLQRADADQHWRRHEVSLTECSSAAPPLTRAHSPIPAQQSTFTLDPWHLPRHTPLLLRRHFAGRCVPDIARVLCDGAIRGEEPAPGSGHDGHLRPLGLVQVRLIHARLRQCAPQ